MWIFFLSFSPESQSHDITKMRSVSFFVMVLEQHAGQDPGNIDTLLFIPSRDCVYSTVLALCSVMNIHKLHVVLLPVPTLQYSYHSAFSICSSL